MKLILMLVGMAVAGILGYFAEPALRPHLVGNSPGDSKSSAPKNDPAAVENVSGVDPATLSPEQLPEKVILKTEVKFSDSTSGVKMSVAAGSSVKLVSIKDDQAVIRPGDTAYTLTLPYANTDLIEQLNANPPEDTGNPLNNPYLDDEPKSETEDKTENASEESTVDGN